MLTLQKMLDVREVFRLIILNSSQEGMGLGAKPGSQ